MAVVRAARPDDLAAVAEIGAHYVLNTVATFAETPQTVAEWRERLDDLARRGLPFLVAEADGEIAGYAYAGPWRPKPAYRYTVEDTIYLAPAHTGKGLGTALLGALVDGSEKAGMRQMIAVIADTGEPGSAALHRRFGFVEAGRLDDVGYKHGRWIATTLMQRRLGPAVPAVPA
ncbi:GNAT family N-acetyltransferase [Actinomadura opuntiae]|uniref:GNAT family N-acetyltransferase n=1 Tax=Actinomadura sp. OS1-43 TaxID=604315 RepID=UPI00255B0E29|nr:GNAT family N-acetyltransferase [Actinomadura sp. OS1-43]MDL4813444.1 N-acetyltransferase family protein [Actinomadura sp. OS1-43]